MPNYIVKVEYMAAIPTPLACDNTCAGTSQVITTPGPAGSGGAAGNDGSDGLNAFTTVANDAPDPQPTMPYEVQVMSATLAIGDPNITVADSSTLEAGMLVSGTGIPAGTTIASIVNPTTVELSQNATANGAQTITFKQNVTVNTTTSTAFLAVNQIVYVENWGYMLVYAIPSATSLTLQNLENPTTGAYDGNAAQGTSLAAASKISPGGVSGLDGADGANGTNGVNSYTVTTADFTMPAISATVAGVAVVNAAWMGIGQTVYVANAGYMIVTAKASDISITLENTGATGNAAGGANIVTGSTISPAGPGASLTGAAGGDLKGNYPNPLIGIGNTKGDILAGDGTDITAVTVGTDNQVLIADAAQTNGVKWGLVDSANIATGAITAPKLASGVGFQPGMLMPYAGSSIPLGWLACDGSAVSRATYSALFTAIGVTWGAGDGFTTFNLPDLRGRTPIGDGTGSGLSVRTLGQSIGTEENTLITTDLPLIEPNTTITPAMSGATPPYKLHATQWDGVGPEYSMDGTDAVNPRGGTVGAPPAQTNVNNMQPSAVVKMIIKT